MPWNPGIGTISRHASRLSTAATPVRVMPPGGLPASSVFGPLSLTRTALPNRSIFGRRKSSSNMAMPFLSPFVGMVYVGGTDNGRWIPELLNDTSDGERHIVVTQNGLADGGYMDWLSLLY